MFIDYLANQMPLVPHVARALYEGCGERFISRGISRDELEREFVVRAVTHQIPIALVAIDRGELAGTGSINLIEHGIRTELSPCIGSMYISPRHRGNGLGALLLSALERKASKLRISTLYLSTNACEGFYVRHGWSVLERSEGDCFTALALMHKNLRIS